MNKRKKYTKIVWFSVLFLCLALCIYMFVYTRNLARKLTVDNAELEVESLHINTVSPNNSLFNIHDESFIAKFLEGLQNVSVKGIITENEIRRGGENSCATVVISLRGGESFEVLLCSEEFDQCYLKPIMGLYSENVHIKIGDCQDLYRMVWNYMQTQ